MAEHFHVRRRTALALQVPQLRIGTPVALPEYERQRLEAALEAHLNAAQSIMERLGAMDGDENLEGGCDDDLGAEDFTHA